MGNLPREIMLKWDHVSSQNNKKCQIFQKIFFNSNDCAKNVVTQWDEAVQILEVIQSFHFLGVEIADSILYNAKYGPTLVEASCLPQWVNEFHTPTGETIAAECESNLGCYFISNEILPKVNDRNRQFQLLEYSESVYYDIQSNCNFYGSFCWNKK